MSNDEGRRGNARTVAQLRGRNGVGKRAHMKEDELAKLADPAALGAPLRALWHDIRGDWDRAHDVCQQARSRDGDWVHAYLHRKEGDLGNAGYWYARAGRAMPPESVSLDEERGLIIEALG